MSNNGKLLVAITNSKLCINKEFMRAGYFLLTSYNKKSGTVLVNRSSYMYNILLEIEMLVNDVLHEIEMLVNGQNTKKTRHLSHLPGENFLSVCLYVSLYIDA